MHRKSYILDTLSCSDKRFGGTRMEALWETSVLELRTEQGTEFKVTRHLHDTFVSETKLFTSREQALHQVEEWTS